MPETRATSAQLQHLRDAQNKYIQYLKAEAQRKADAAERRDVTADVVTAEADASITFVLIKGHVTADLLFSSGQKMHFDAWPWGVGAAGGTGHGLYYGVPADVLAGGCHYHCQGISSPAGVFQITCWRDNFGALGQINVAMIGVGVFEIGGDDGQWTHS